MVQIDITYSGALRCESTHAPSGAQLITDAPLDNCGKGESFSPTDLVATALGSCMLTIMGIVADRHGWDLSDAHVSVKKGMAADPVRRISSLAVLISVPGEFDAKQRVALEKAALSCPVHRSIAGQIDIPVEFEFGAAAGQGKRHTD